MENLPPSLASDLSQSLWDNQPYPTTLQMQCLIRIKADRNITSIRAAILKAYLNRKFRNHNNPPKEIQMALDLENKNQAYLCGRLFAILEKIQSDAIQRELILRLKNATTVQHRQPRQLYSAACCLYPDIILQNLIQGNLFIMKSYCKVLSLIWIVTGYLNIYRWTTSQRFAIGYSHQREDLYKTTTDKEKKLILYKYGNSNKQSLRLHLFI